ncbi:elongation factor P--(R)-beta-lysine ligase [Colwelliaceae bacterium 6441]
MSWESNISWQTAKQRSTLIHLIRHFFYEKNIVEVETPILCQSTVTDVYLESFSCNFNYSNDNKNKVPSKLYLQTSPEFAMKRLIASGYGSIFQLCKAFRHEEQGRYHNPEFSMLEWYRIGFDHFQLMDEVNELLQVTLQCKSAEKLTYQDAFLKYLNVDPLCCSIELLKTRLSENNVTGDWILEENDIDVLLQVLFSECIEPNIGKDRPCFIYNYPRNQASLAKLCALDDRVAERFECYFKGVELANGFNELTDLNEQLQRFKCDNHKRKTLGKEEKTPDELFLSALKSGLPNCSGVALGIDRLIMLAFDRTDIASTMTFNISNA